MNVRQLVFGVRIAVICDDISAICSRQGVAETVETGVLDCIPVGIDRFPGISRGIIIELRRMAIAVRYADGAIECIEGCGIRLSAAGSR